jgi:hypothetical protein
MTDVETEVGTPERIGRVIGETLAALIILAVVVMMIVQFA